MTSLYELTGQYLALSQLADDPDMPEEALADSLEGLEGELEIKAEAILQVVAGMAGDTSVIDGEIRRLQARKKVIQNRADRLREYLRSNMEVSGISKIECPLFNITLAKGREVVLVEDPDAVPADFVKETVTRAPVKAEILKALKAGLPVAGCRISRSKPSLRVK